MERHAYDQSRQLVLVGALTTSLLANTFTAPVQPETTSYELSDGAAANTALAPEVSRSLARPMQVKLERLNAATDERRASIAASIALVPNLIAEVPATPSVSVATPSPSPTSIPTVETTTTSTGYWFGALEPTKRFNQLGSHAHQIAQLEFTMGKAHGLSDAAIGCTQDITVMESRNEELAVNSESGAYGLEQALPAGKMALAGSDYRINPATQIKWFFIATELPKTQGGRYGSECKAWGHWLNYRSW